MAKQLILLLRFENNQTSLLGTCQKPQSHAEKLSADIVFSLLGA